MLMSLGAAGHHQALAGDLIGEAPETKHAAPAAPGWPAPAPVDSAEAPANAAPAWTCSRWRHHRPASLQRKTAHPDAAIGSSGS